MPFSPSYKLLTYNVHVHIHVASMHMYGDKLVHMVTVCSITNVLSHSRCNVQILHVSEGGSIVQS